MKKLLLRYSEKALFPAQLTAGDPIGTCYLLYGGEEVRFKYIMGCNDNDGRYDEELDKLCGELYGMGFRAIRNVWESRIGRLSGYWHYVEMLPAERAAELVIGCSDKKIKKRR